MADAAACDGTCKRLLCYMWTNVFFVWFLMMQYCFSLPRFFLYQSTVGMGAKKGSRLTSFYHLRKMRDSNPRYPEKGIPDFESSAFGHSANLPFSECKSNNIL